VAVLCLGDSGSYEGMRRHIFEASWGVSERGFYRAFIRCGAQVFYGQIYLQFVRRSNDSVRVFKRGKIPDSVLIRASTLRQLHITLSPWFRLLQRHGAVLKAGWRAADDGRRPCGVAVAQVFRRGRVMLQPWAAT
jgi:hypothetical protein